MKVQNRPQQVQPGQIQNPSQRGSSQNPPPEAALMVFDIIGTYFVKTYWTSLYDIAKDQYESGVKGFSSLEDSYSSAVDIYTRAVSKRENSAESTNKSYVAIVKSLFEETKQYIKNIHTLADFIDYVAKQFIHPEYYAIMSKQAAAKETMFRNILKEALGQFSIFVVTEEIAIVLDPTERSSNWQENLLLWQKKFISILQNEKSKLVKLFLSEKHGVKIDDRRDEETVPKELADRMTDKIRGLMSIVGERDEMIEKQKKFIDFLKTTISTRDRTMQNLMTQLQSLGIINESGQVVYKQPRVRGARSASVSSSTNVVSVLEDPHVTTPSPTSSVVIPGTSMADIAGPILEAEYSNDEVEEFGSEERMMGEEITDTRVDIEAVLEDADEPADEGSYEDLIPDDE
jgi:hypothetical protein